MERFNPKTILTYAVAMALVCLIAGSGFAQGPEDLVETIQEPPAQLYMVLQPYDKISVKMGPVWQTINYTWALAKVFGKLTGIGKVGGVGAVIVGMGWELAKGYPTLRINTAQQMYIAEWFKWNAAIRRMAAIPGVKKVYIPYSNNTRYNGIMAVAKDDLGYIFVESTMDLEKYQKVHPEIENLVGGEFVRIPHRNHKIAFTLSIGGQPVGRPWVTTTDKILSEAPIDRGTFRSWQKDVRKFVESQSRSARYITQKYDEDLSIRGLLYYADGSTRDLLPLFTGGSVREFLRLKSWQTSWDYLRVKAFREPRKLGHVPVKKREYNCRDYMSVFSEALF